MKFSILTLSLATALSLPVLAQNLAVVNGKPVPSSRVEALKQQIERSGKPVTPEILGQIKEELIAREIFMQEARKRGLDATEDYKTQLELARQSLLIRELFANFQKKNPVTDAEIKTEYDKFAAANGGKEYRARHILVEKETDAKAIIAKNNRNASNAGCSQCPILKHKTAAGIYIECAKFCGLNCLTCRKASASSARIGLHRSEPGINIPH